MVGVQGLPVEKFILEKCLYNTGCSIESVLHVIQHVALLPVALHQRVDAVPVTPEVEGRALVQELLQL